MKNHKSKADLFFLIAMIMIVFFHSNAYPRDWKWQNPLPQGQNLNGIWGSSENNVFAVGFHGTILHNDGTGWILMENPLNNTEIELSDIWGSSPDNIFAVGGDYTNPGIILHYDGTQWRQISTDASAGLNSVWGSSANDVYVVGDTGIILHYDGSSWSPANSSKDLTEFMLYGIWGTSANDIFVVGSRGIILHFDGSSWKELVRQSSSLYDVWGSSGNDVYAVGLNGEMVHYDGSLWTNVSVPVFTQFSAIWGYSSIDIFALGDIGVILHYDGSSWTEMTNKTDVLGKDIWGSSGTNVFAVGESGSILHFDGSQWKETTSPTSTLNSLTSIWGSSKNNIFAVGSNGSILNYDGTTWSEMESPVRNTEIYLLDVWGSSKDNVFAVGSEGTILNYDGALWTQITISSSVYIRGIWGISANNIFAVGDSGLILHYDGSQWEFMASGTQEGLISVWGFSASDVFAVGREGKIFHYDGDLWTEHATLSAGENGSGYPPNVHGIWGSSSENIFAVGGFSSRGEYGFGSIFHYNGAAWTQTFYDMGSSYELKDIWGFSENNIYAVGGGIILHYDGNTWTEMDRDARYGMSSVWGFSFEDVVAVGNSARIFGYEETPDKGVPVISGLRIKAVIHSIEKGNIYGVWKKGGDDTTSRGDQVVWGYFYADPNDVPWGSINNPEVFAKIWYDAGGRVDVNFFHVSVPDIEVTATYNGVDLKATATTTKRYIRHYYNDNNSDGTSENTEDGIPVSGYSQTNSPVGYPTINNLNIGAMINTVETIGSIDAVWTLGGTDTTSRGDQVVWGHFYADPNDVNWGNKNNPELFVKIWFDAGGRIDVNYFHVSVPDIEVYSDYGSDGIYDTKGTTIMDDRYIRHEYYKQ